MQIETIVGSLNVRFINWNRN